MIDYFEKRLYFRSGEPSGETQQALGESLRRGGFHEIVGETSSIPAILIELKINGEPAKLLVDTGATFSVLESTHLKRLHLDQKPTWITSVGVGSIGSTRLHVTTVKRLELGSLSLTNVDFGAADLSGWKIGKAGTAWEDVDGLLGSVELHNCHALIDCRAQKLWMRPPRHTAPAPNPGGHS